MNRKLASIICMSVSWGLYLFLDDPQKILLINLWLITSVVVLVKDKK